MLLLGLPGVIVLGFGLAVLIFNGLSIYEAAILATMLAATDAALGKAVITNQTVPARLREGLNVESGLNDGICVPILLFFIALAVTTEHGGQSISALMLIAQELGIGMAVGWVLALAGVRLLRWCMNQGWVTEIWMQLTVVGLAIACFSVADSSARQWLHCRIHRRDAVRLPGKDNPPTNSFWRPRVPVKRLPW